MIFCWDSESVTLSELRVICVFVLSWLRLNLTTSFSRRGLSGIPKCDENSIFVQNVATPWEISDFRKIQKSTFQQKNLVEPEAPFKFQMNFKQILSLIFN